MNRENILLYSFIAMIMLSIPLMFIHPLLGLALPIIFIILVVYFMIESEIKISKFDENT